MRGSCSFIRRTGAVARKHGPGAPACEAHKVGLASILGQPVVGETVPEKMSVNALKACLGGAVADDLVDP